MAAVQLKMAELEARRERVEAVQRKSSEYIQRTERLRQKVCVLLFIISMLLCCVVVVLCVLLCVVHSENI